MMPSTASSAGVARRLVLPRYRALLILLLVSPPSASSFHCYHHWSGAKGVPQASLRSPSFLERSVRAWSSPSPSSAASEGTADAPSLLEGMSKLYGGDMAGHSATFSASDGSLIRVPEHLVPESLIEWGQVPSCFEVLTSEDLATDAGSADVLKLERQTVAVVPEVGCGVDNLDTMRSSDTFELSLCPESTDDVDSDDRVGAVSTYIVGDTAVVAWDAPIAPLRGVARRRVETAFELPDDIEASEDGDDATYRRRVRVSFEVLPTQREVVTPITAVVERQTSAVSSGGTIGQGGGLDGRTVTRLIGSSVNRPFADGKGASIGDLAEGDVRTLSLPGNIVVRYGTSPSPDVTEKWRIDVSLVNVGADDVIVGQTLVRRWFGGGEGRSAEDVDCWYEKKA